MPKDLSLKIEKKIADAPRFTNGFLEALVQLPVPLQLAYLRRHYGISQLEVAEQLKVKQSYASRLEKEGSDHLFSNYERLAELLRCRLVLIPKEARVVPR